MVERKRIAVTLDEHWAKQLVQYILKDGYRLPISGEIDHLVDEAVREYLLKHDLTNKGKLKNHSPPTDILEKINEIKTELNNLREKLNKLTKELDNLTDKVRSYYNITES